MRELRVGVVGCGRMGQERARCIVKSGAALAATYDIDTIRRTELAKLYNAASATSVSELLGSDLDAVFICTAPGSRAGMELTCIAAGLPFYVEKPIGISVAAASGIGVGIRETAVIHGIGYMNRYRRSIQLAKRILQGTEVIGFSAYWICRRYKVPWWEIVSESGGPHNEQATHLYDLIRYLIGEVTSVKSIFGGTSRVATALECANSVLGTIIYSCDGSDKDIGLRIFTSKGSLLLSGWDFWLCENNIDNKLLEEEKEDIFLIETGRFLEAVRRQDQGLIESNVEEALKTQAVMDSVGRSSKVRGNQVQVEEYSVMVDT